MGPLDYTTETRLDVVLLSSESIITLRCKKIIINYRSIIVEWKISTVHWSHIEVLLCVGLLSKYTVPPFPFSPEIFLHNILHSYVCVHVNVGIV